MDEYRITTAASTITKRKAALAWLEQYGVQLTGKGDCNYAAVNVHLNFASACAGSKEAAEVLSAYSRVHLPEIVKDAIACCRNDIAMSVDAIRKEIEKA